jgi:hypothetical protein
MAKIVSVKFPGSCTNYFFKAADDVEWRENDYVVCDTAQGLSLGVIVDACVPDKGAAKATKWIIQRIDMVAHRARMETEKQIQAIQSKLEKCRKQAEERVIYEMLAEKDPEAKKLLDELDSLTKQL